MKGKRPAGREPESPVKNFVKETPRDSDRRYRVGVTEFPGSRPFHCVCLCACMCVKQRGKFP